jgi:alkylation response protein AidB-like acyl-CoA dehydrogenase
VSELALKEGDQVSEMQPRALERISMDGIRPPGPPPAGLTVDKAVEAVREARPLIAARAAETEQLRYVAEPAWQALWQSGIFWLTAPRDQGGFDVESHDPIIEAVALIGESCVSTAWCAAQIIQQQWMLRLFSDEFQEEVRQRSPLICAAGNGTAFGTGRREDGGLRISGRYRYGSNAMYAEWLFGFAHIEEADGSRNLHCVFVPAADAVVLDTWHVDGVIGSGSHDFVFDDVFVPAHRVQLPAELLRRRPEHPNPMLRVPLLQYPHFFSAAPILGAARGAVAAWRAKLAGGGPGGGPVDKAVDHELLARCDTAVRIADLAMHDAGRKLIAMHADGTEPPETDRLALRLQVSHAAEMCRNALRAISDASGSSAHLLANPQQRALRDATMLSTHATINPHGLTEAYGRMMLGLPADVPGPRPM